MKRVLLVLITVVAVFAVANPQRGILAADGVEGVDDGDGTAYTAADYIQDGLVAMWDGHESNGYTDLIAGKEFSPPDGYDLPIRTYNGYLFTGRTQKMTADITDLPWESAPVKSWRPHTFEFCISPMAQPTTVRNFYVATSPAIRWYNRRLFVPYLTDTFAMSELPSGTYSFAKGRARGASDIDPSFVYINGEVQAYYNLRDWTIYPLTIGDNKNTSNVGLDGYFLGTLHAVRCYSRQLTEEEIQYNSMIDKERFGL